MTMIEATYGNEPISLDELNAAVQRERSCRADVTTLKPGDRIAMLNFTTGLYEAHTVVDAVLRSRSGRGDDHVWMVELEDSKHTFRCSPKFTGCYRITP